MHIPFFRLSTWRFFLSLACIQAFSWLCLTCRSKVPVLSAKNDTLRYERLKRIFPDESTNLSLGAFQIQEYFPEMQNKRVGLVVNHTSLLGDVHLVDTLINLGVRVRKVFAPEHGFRGQADAGEKVQNSIDLQTGVPIISLYGKKKKPSTKDLDSLDVLIFDIQDVGTRFYTYISTMHYVMEACAENNKKLVILDRPNPNGAYVDGPVRKPQYQSFVGMHPIPIVHGLTVGELALMINGEGWLKGGRKCDLKVIKNRDYRHNLFYSLPIKPSPNLPNDLSIQLYPSLCLFEGTQISVARGTEFPFQAIGAPQKNLGNFVFRPRSIVGMSKNPKYQDRLCYGIDFRDQDFQGGFTLKYLIDFYKKYQDKKNFFTGYFDTLAGTDQLRKQIQAGMSEQQIRKTWEADLVKYMKMREKYLLYQ